MKQTMILIGLILFCVITSTDGEKDSALQKLFPHRKESKTKNMTVSDTWKHLESELKYVSRQAIRIVLSAVGKHYDKLNVSQKCLSQSFHVLMGVQNIKVWALRFVDSSGKSIDGLLEGAFSALGSYDECIDTEVKSTRLHDKGKILFRGQYCTIEAFPTLPPKKDFFKVDDVPEEFKSLAQRDSVIGAAAKYANILHFVNLRFGLCVPSGCSQEDINNVVSKIGDILSINIEASTCEVKKNYPFTPLEIAVISCYSFVTFLVFIGTSIDVFTYYTKTVYEGTCIRILLAFSLYTNFRKFIHTGQASATLSCLNGIRFFGISWVIVGHTYLNVNFQGLNTLSRVPELAKDFAFQAIVNATVAVDTFFVMGGMLVCYHSVKLVRFQGYRFRIWLYIVHRLWRIIPVYVFVLILPFTANLFGSGPLWHDMVQVEFDTCYENMWTNLLFINNFYNALNMCLSHTWYVAADFQLYLGSLIILIPLLRKPKIGLFLAMFSILSCVIYSGIATYIYDFPPTMLLSHPDFQQLVVYTASLFYRPFVHAAPYSLGLIAGYILATKPDLKMPPRILVLGWSAAIAVNMSVLYGVYGWNSGKESPLWVSLLYASVFRTAWSLGVVWMIVCCATGHGGIINYILSWKVFVPLGRLTYAAYLTHPLFQFYYLGNMRNLLQTYHYIAIWAFLGTLCLSYAASFCLSMLVEYPFSTLEKIILQSTVRRKNNSSVEEKNAYNGSMKPEENIVINGNDIKTEIESNVINNKSITSNL